MMAFHLYILVKHKPVGVYNVVEWGKWFETNNRTVKRTNIGDIEISTVFIGIDHSFGFVKKPLLFETKIFGGDLDGYQDRYATWIGAEYGHDRAVKLVKLSLLKPTN